MRNPTDILAYEGVITKLICNVKLLSLTTSGMALGLQPVLLSKVLESMSVVAAVVYGIFFTSFIFLSPLLIHNLSRRYVTKLYFDQESKQFRAVTLNLLTFEKETTFTAKDVILPKGTGFFTTFKIGKKPYFVDSRMFNDKNIYCHLMGYDKPLDLGFGLDDKS